MLKYNGLNHCTVGDVWKVHVPHRDTLNLKPCYWRGGSLYNYGLGEAHYPVPTTVIDSVLATAFSKEWWHYPDPY